MGELLEHVGEIDPLTDEQMPALEAAFDASRRGSAVMVHHGWPRVKILVREQRVCDWCGRPTVTYQPPGNPQPGGRACKKKHATRMQLARRRDRCAFERRQMKRASKAAARAARALARSRAHERRMLDPAWRAENCPRPDKLVWLTREGAGMQLADMLGKPWFTDTETLQVYECACGGFHVGNARQAAGDA